ncbi:F-box/FBD/LRR-repeat protein At1g13570-like [Rutidosis leptorrhynchoides]|uniref:F-box/FBD/LRR-repeat protein At1g13570-like n=1 Tax=Rutidosis leptorrhynchoides TaxID=125765 RepID=UPI003A99E32A
MKPKHSSSDIISGLPEIIIETILCLVPIRDAVTTSILSKKWRYSWNKIPKLVFNEEDMFNKLKEKHREEEDEENIEREEDDEENTENEVLTGKYKFFYAIHQVLLMHHGSIIEFSLSMKSNYKCVELDQIITYLSRKNTVKKLTLELNGYNSTYELPLSFFSFHQLTDLYLQHCNLEHHQPIVDGFGMLTSLFLNNVDITGEQILHIVSKSPLLKSFSLVQSDYRYAFSRAPMCDLFGYIPAIEHLYLAILHFNSNWSSLRELPTPLVHLKYAHLLSQCFTGRYGLLSSS